MKRLIKILRGLISLLLFAVVVLGSLYVLGVTVKPVGDWLRHKARGTVAEPLLARLLPASDTEHAADTDAPVATTLPTQAVEVMLSAAAAKNIGIDDAAIAKIAVVDFFKSLTFPAVVLERPGRAKVIVPSPVAGVVTRIHHESGVAVRPGDPLFDITLSQQELVRGQIDYLALLKKREINAAELQRIGGLDPEIVPKQWRDLTYEKLQLDLEVELQRNVLLLQGLDAATIVESLEAKGEIVRSMTVFAPALSEDGEMSSAPGAPSCCETLTLEALSVSQGKNVAIGDSLCELSDLSQLAIRAKVFVTNEKEVNRALASKSRVSAAFERNGTREIVEGLSLRSIDNRIDTEYGTLFCYADLVNRSTTYETEGVSPPRRYTQWYFKPGERCELQIEYEPLPSVIVVPVDAVAHDISEMCLFEWVGNEDAQRIWRKRPVHVVHRTREVVVIANDGAVFPGAKVAIKGASFILAALNAANQKNASGGGIQHGDHVH